MRKIEEKKILREKFVREDENLIACCIARLPLYRGTTNDSQTPTSNKDEYDMLLGCDCHLNSLFFRN